MLSSRDCITRLTRCFGDFRFVLKDDFAVECDTRKCVLFKEYNVLLLQAEIALLGEIFTCFAYSSLTGHYIPVIKQYNLYIHDSKII